MQIVHKLSHVSHAYLVAMVVEYIERKRGDHSISHGALLLEKIVPLAGTRAVGVLASPLVNYQLKLILLAVSTNNAPVAENYLIHTVVLYHKRLDK